MLLYPRIKKSVKDSLDASEGLQVVTKQIQFTKKVEEMHTILIELL